MFFLKCKCTWWKCPILPKTENSWFWTRNKIPLCYIKYLNGKVARVRCRYLLWLSYLGATGDKSGKILMSHVSLFAVLKVCHTWAESRCAQVFKYSCVSSLQHVCPCFLVVVHPTVQTCWSEEMYLCVCDRRSLHSCRYVRVCVHVT